MTIKKYLDIEGLTLYDNNIKTYIKNLKDVQVFNSLTSFPSEGKDDTLYLATSTKALYAWSADIKSYFRIGIQEETLNKIDTAYTIAQSALEIAKAAKIHAEIADGSNPHQTLYKNIIDIPNVATQDDILSLIN